MSFTTDSDLGSSNTLSDSAIGSFRDGFSCSSQEGDSCLGPSNTTGLSLFLFSSTIADSAERITGVFFSGRSQEGGANF